jgi:hypothetical protein
MFAANHRRLALAMVILVAGLVILATLANGAIAGQPPEDTKASPPEDLKKVVLKLVAERNGLPFSELAVVNSATAEYPFQGKTVFAFKVIDNRSGTVYGVTMDRSGQELDSAQLEADEQAAYAAKYGRLEPALAEQLAGAPEDEPIEVIIWLNEPPYAGLERPQPKVGSGILPTEGQQILEPMLDTEALLIEEQQKVFFEQVDAHRAAAVESVVTPVANRLTQLGHNVAADKYAPALYAHLTPKTIREVAGWAEVAQVYLSKINQPALEVARATINAHIVQSRGITGSGVKVAQIEVGAQVGNVRKGVVVATNNPYLSGVIQNWLYACSSSLGHETAVAGIIRSTHSSRRGIAPGVSLWAGGSCNGLSTELQNRSTYAANWGARAFNLSWGEYSSLTPRDNDRFYDNMVINMYRTIVVAAGNAGTTGCQPSNGYVGSPGLAYNVITVGNFDDRNTVGWSNPPDVMAPCSSWKDPTSTHNDREKPEVAAPGTNINSTTTGWPWTGGVGSGTSYAAPMVTGVAALLMQRNTNLQSWPESVKAILMATALHNIEGVERLSEYDGAGGIDAARADWVAMGGSTGSWGGISYSCSTTTPLDVATVYLTGGKRTRVVIAWDNDPNYGSYASQPGADLDLEVISPSGSAVAGSYSWDNTYEIVDFTPSSSGNYKLRVNRFRCNYSPRWLGWAWWNG